MSSRRVAIVTPDVMGPILNGGVGTSCRHLAELLANDGYDVHLIFATSAPIPKKWLQFYEKRKVKLMGLPEANFELQAGSHWTRMSYEIYEFLRVSDYPLVIFPDMGGLGYFSQMAKKSGLAFHQTNFLIKFLGPLTWSKHDNGDFLNGPAELTIPMMEKFSVENADVVQYATDWSTQWCDEKLWNLPTKRQALFPFQVGERKRTKASRAKSLDEIVFFGRIEPRKGIDEFLKALLVLKEQGFLRGRKVTLLGSIGLLWYRDMRHSIGKFCAASGIRVNIIENLNSEEAIEYLRAGGRLAVIASRSETMGFTILECLGHEIPFIASRIEPFEHLVGRKHKDRLFEPKIPAQFAAAISEAALDGRAIVDRGRAVDLCNLTRSRWLRIVKDCYPASSVAGRIKKTASPRQISEQIRVSVLIAHFERAQFLDEALESLFVQTLKPFEVIVYDDKSSSNSHLQTIRKFKARFKKVGISFRFIQAKENRGPSFARNQMAKVARGDFLLFMDDDNRAVGHEIETLNRIQRHTNADVVTVAIKKFVDGQDELWFERRWTPIGFDLNAAMFENIFGDTNFLMRRTLFLKLGGFVDDPLLTAEDMNILVKAALQKSKMWVCPEPLVEYRVHSANRSRVRSPHERLFHIGFFLNRLARDANLSKLDSLSSMLSGWNSRFGTEWVSDPPFWPRKLKSSEAKRVNLLPDLKKYLPSNRRMAIGLASRVYLSNRGRLTISLESLNVKHNEPLFLDLVFGADHNGILRCSNSKIEHTFPSGFTTLRIPFYGGENFWIECRGLDHLFIAKLDLLRLKAAPLPTPFPIRSNGVLLKPNPMALVSS